MNTQQTLTPSSRDVVRFCRARAAFDTRPDIRTAAAQRVLASRWRQRWNGRLGQFQVGEIDEIGCLRLEAFWVCPGEFSTLFRGRILADKSRLGVCRIL